VAPAAAASPLLAGLDADRLRSVLAASVERSLAGGATLFDEGDVATSLFLVTAGRIKLSQLSAEGHEVVVRVAGPGEALGGLAVLDGRPYPFGARAVLPTRVRCWTRRALLELFQGVTGFEANVLRIVGAHGRELLDRFRELATEPVPRRLARLLLRLADGATSGASGTSILGVTQQDLAGMTGTTLYTVSRTLAGWSRAGVLQTGRGRLLLKRKDRLRKLAEGRDHDDRRQA
jgi:CRP-like cAMP-binding protein